MFFEKRKVFQKIYKKIFSQFEVFIQWIVECIFWWILFRLSIVFIFIFYFINQIRAFCMISMFTINTKINFGILLLMDFMFFENETKVCLKIYKKNIFLILESLFDYIQNGRICWILLRYSILFNDITYFMNQLRSVCMI